MKTGEREAEPFNKRSPTTASYYMPKDKFLQIVFE